jgi:hypothetical protein
MFEATQELSLDGVTYEKGNLIENPTRRMIDGGLVKEFKGELLTEVSEPVETSVEDEVNEDEVNEDEVNED